MQKGSQLFPKGLPPRAEYTEASVALLEGSSNFACVTETKRADPLKEEALGGASPQGLQGLGFSHHEVRLFTSTCTHLAPASATAKSD